MTSAKWDALYLIPVASAITLLATFLVTNKNVLDNPMNYWHSFALYVLSFGVLVYFWYWDAESPGFKSKYEGKSLLVKGTAVAVLGFFTVLFAIVLYEPSYFAFGVSLVYLAKTSLNASFSSLITDRTDVSLNLLAVYSDVVATVVFGFYSIFSLAFVSNRTDVLFKDCMVAVSYSTIIAFEGYYQLVARALGKMSRVDEKASATPQPTRALRP